MFEVNWPPRPRPTLRVSRPSAICAARRPSFEGVQGQIAKELGGVDTRKVGRGLGGQFASNIGAGIKAAATGTVAVAAGLLGTALVKGLGRLNALDQATQKLNGLGHSADSVDAIMKNWRSRPAKGTAFGMDAAATVAASSVAAGIKPGKDLERTLSLVADAATIAGTDMGLHGRDLQQGCRLQQSADGRH